MAWYSRLKGCICNRLFDGAIVLLCAALFIINEIKTKLCRE